MSQISAEKLAANKANAQHSTGPRTSEGKARSRMNALKHGLRIETIALPIEDRDALDELHGEWHGFYQPQTPGEYALIDQAVNAIIQRQRCQRFQTAMLNHQVENAERRFDQDLDAQIHELIKHLQFEPGTTVFTLKAFAAGCRWMIGRWERLLERLEADGTWVGLDRDEAVQLQGFKAFTDRLPDSEPAYLTYIYGQYSEANPDDFETKRLMSKFRMPETMWAKPVSTWLPDAAECRARLRRIGLAQLEMLREREEMLRVQYEVPARRRARERAVILDDKDGPRFLRYDRFYESAFHRSYNALLKGRKYAEETGLLPGTLTMALETCAEPPPDVAGASADGSEKASAPNEPKSSGGGGSSREVKVTCNHSEALVPGVGAGLATAGQGGPASVSEVDAAV